MLFLLTTFALESRCKDTNISRYGKIKKNAAARKSFSARRQLGWGNVVLFFYHPGDGVNHFFGWSELVGQLCF